ncbi:MAG: ABC transporter permease [Alphaproteobacteria bacterium]|nr:ABC transporter permease [Alphaproteobacteria bacterium]
MASYLVQRVIALALTLLVATVVVFCVLNIVPGDPASYMMGLNADPDALAQLRSELGLDQPAWQRYATWLGNLVQGDLGTSYTYRVPVTELVGERLSVSLPLTLLATALSLGIALPLGIFAAARRGRLADTAVVGATQLGIAIPNFWFAILLVFFFATTLHWFSAGGFPGWDEGVGPALQALILPAIALALPQAAILTRVTRSSLLETLSEDFIRTARAKGLSEGQALRRHALRNALIPVLTILGLQFTFLLAGGIIVENVFYLPGLGRLVLQAITQRDLIVVQGVVIVLVAAAVAITFLVEVAYMIADPRVRTSRP